jgi:predicted lipid-binding transport protein (Tim44 family)
MRANQLTRGTKRRVMYVENKDGDIDGAEGRIGWVTFSQSGMSVYYRGRTLRRSSGRGVRGNYHDEGTGQEYWVSGVKKRGSNAHWAESVRIRIDPDAREEYRRLRGLPDTGTT